MPTIPIRRRDKMALNDNGQTLTTSSALGFQVGDIITFQAMRKRPWWAFWRKHKPIETAKQFVVSWTDV